MVYTTTLLKWEGKIMYDRIFTIFVNIINALNYKKKNIIKVLPVLFIELKSKA